MAKVFSEITAELQSWIGEQHIFFVATAPRADDGHINCSPKGGETFRILSPTEVVYQDYTGSGAESVAHLRENGRTVLMFVALTGAPKIVRLHGIGTVITPEEARYPQMTALFPPHVGTRAFIHLKLNRISDSCGYSIPFFDYRADRDTLDQWSENKGLEKIAEYREKNNRQSIDGLPAFDGN